MGQTTEENRNWSYSAWNWQGVLPGSRVEMVLPAHLELLPVLGALVREYCAALPHVFNLLEPVPASRRGRAGSARREAGPVGGQAAYSHFVYSIELVLQETASNVIRHGFASPAAGQHLKLQLGAAILTGRPPRRALLMEIVDNAAPFDPTLVRWSEPDPLQPRESGYGIYLIRKLTNLIAYRYEGGYNHLSLLKYVDSLD